MRPRRKAIPHTTKLLVLGLQDFICPECGEIVYIENAEFDHRPALIMRPVDASGTDYEPPQLDPFHINALHAPCHQKRTTGRAIGAERTVTTKGSDIWLKTKFARLERKASGHLPKRKKPFPSRPFPKTKRGFR
jgi:hypothetical protein